ncbi:extracellular solute-binding protein [uncultured Nocardioides sp.]|uniref:ABC transporter substrate-binding protein n=1 Tax=uncultured Nocardioides sp. TaxID=198441 RepID=UPI00262B8D07|nr:extracellular solute-binding protein [uncultured Nocardioides sp.]
MRVRRLSMTGALAVTASLVLASCGGGSDSEESSSGPQTLTIWHYYTADGQIAALERQNELFAEANPDVEFEVVQIPFEQLPTRLLSTATTQDGPDIVLDNVVVDFPALAGSGVLTDLTPYWEDYADAEEVSDSSVWRLDDEVYNVMSYTNLLGLYYNADILDELGIEPPQTVDEFQAALEQVADDGQYTPLTMAGAPTVEGAWMYFPLLLGEGVDYCNLDQDSLEGALGRLQGWSEDGILPREAANWDQTDAWTQFASGDAAFGINGNWNLGAAPDLPFELGSTQFPAGSEGSRVFPGGEGLGIGAFADDPDLAWQYIEDAWLSPEAGLINFEDSGQIPTRADVASQPEVADDELVAPFVEAASNTASWPLNEETAQMQTVIGQVGSSVISGETEAAEAAERGVTGVEEAKEEGGGGCE